jgi:hypothetical protein
MPATGVYDYQGFITDTYDAQFSQSNLRLQSELTTTQQGYKMLVLPESTGTFNKVSTPPPPLAHVGFFTNNAVFNAGIIDIVGTIAIGADVVNYYVTNNSGNSVNLTLIVEVYNTSNTLLTTRTALITSTSADDGTVVRTHDTRETAVDGYLYSYSVSLT